MGESSSRAAQRARARAEDPLGRRPTPPRESEVERQELELFTSLGRISLLFQALQRDCLKDHGLAFTEYSVLRLLQAAPQRRLPPSQLAEEIICTTGSMTKLVDRLERAGLVERQPDPKDRRGVLVKITPAGHRTANAAARAYRVGRERILARLGPRRSRSVRESLDLLLAAMEQDRTD